MIELILARHAKSDWGDTSITDHARPLNARGRRDAPLMAERLARSGASVDLLLSSTAVRARTTAAHFGEELGVEITEDRDLYLASGDALFMRAAAPGAASVMVVAHDPGLSELAWRLSDGGITHMPTCAVARFVWEPMSGARAGDADPWDAAALRPADRWSFDSPRGGALHHRSVSR